jgi:hypothetical protein
VKVGELVDAVENSILAEFQHCLLRICGAEVQNSYFFLRVASTKNYHNFCCIQATELTWGLFEIQLNVLFADMHVTHIHMEQFGFQCHMI